MYVKFKTILYLYIYNKNLYKIFNDNSNYKNSTNKKSFGSF